MTLSPLECLFGQIFSRRPVWCQYIVQPSGPYKSNFFSSKNSSHFHYRLPKFAFSAVHSARCFSCFWKTFRFMLLIFIISALIQSPSICTGRDVQFHSVLQLARATAGLGWRQRSASVRDCFLPLLFLAPYPSGPFKKVITTLWTVQSYRQYIAATFLLFLKIGWPPFLSSVSDVSLGMFTKMNGRLRAWYGWRNFH